MDYQDNNDYSGNSQKMDMLLDEAKGILLGSIGTAATLYKAAIAGRDMEFWALTVNNPYYGALSAAAYIYVSPVFKSHCFWNNSLFMFRYQS